MQAATLPVVSKELYEQMASRSSTILKEKEEREKQEEDKRNRRGMPAKPMLSRKESYDESQGCCVLPAARLWGPEHPVVISNRYSRKQLGEGRRSSKHKLGERASFMPTSPSGSDQCDQAFTLQLETFEHPIPGWEHKHTQDS
eukprot:3185476-Pyramimonas_sp.AAC.1